MSSTCTFIRPTSPFSQNNYNNKNSRRTLSIIHEENISLDQQILNLNQSSPHPAFRNDNFSSPNEIMSGPLVLVSSINGPQRILMSVIRTTTDHFAMVYRFNNNYQLSMKSKLKSNPICCINLRGVVVGKDMSFGSRIVGFTLKPKNLDYVTDRSTSSSGLMFICPDECMLEKWIDSLRWTDSNQERIRKSSMPLLEEEDEFSEEEE